MTSCENNGGGDKLTRYLNASEIEDSLDNPESFALVGREVHLGRVVRPGTEHELADLLVERVEPDVDGAHGAEDAPGLPAHSTVPSQHRLEFFVLAVDAFSTGKQQQQQQQQQQLNSQLSSLAGD